MATIVQNGLSKTNWANAIWLAIVVMLGSWNLPFVVKWLTPEAVACMSLILNIIMRNYTVGSLENK